MAAEGGRTDMVVVEEEKGSRNRKSVENPSRVFDFNFMELACRWKTNDGGG